MHRKGNSMTELYDHAGAEAPPPPAPQVPDVSSTDGHRFSPRRLSIIFVVVLAAVVGGSLLADGIVDRSWSNDQSMGNWMSSYGSHYLDVSHDVAAVASASDSTSLRHACVKLQGDVGVARTEPAMPVHSLESQWAVVLSNLSTAADDCVNGIDHRNSALIDTAQTHMTDAGEAYLRLVRAVQNS